MNIPAMAEFVGVEEARIIRFIGKLAEGDPVAWGFVAFFLVIGIISAIVKGRQ